MLEVYEAQIINCSTVCVARVKCNIKTCLGNCVCFLACNRWFSSTALKFDKNVVPLPRVLFPLLLSLKAIRI